MWIPGENTELTIRLPGEITRATVTKVVDPNTLIVELTSVPMSKTHNYRFRDLLAVRRKKDYLQNETWEAVEERRSLPSALESISAPSAGPQPSGREPQHKGDDRKRSSKAPSRRRSPVKRAKVPKTKRRTRASKP